MRERCPVAYSEFLAWSIFRHDDIETILLDPETYSSASRRLAVPNGMDAPEHTAYRAAQEPFFSSDQMATFDSQCRKVARALVGPLVARSTVEIVADFADPFSMRSLCAFLGWPEENWGYLLGWTHGNLQAAYARDRDAGKTLAEEFTHYVMEQIDARRTDGRSESGDDVTSRLMRRTVNGRRMTDEELISALRNWTAGHGTVVAGLSNLLLYLARHPQFQDHLRSEPGLIPAAVDEVLRVDGPLVSNRRTTTREVEIGGRVIDAGQNLTLMWLAADRDPREFDEPTTVNLDRDQAGNFLFGAGIHYCVGAPMARLELRIALEELLSHTRELALAGNPNPPRSTNPGNGVESLQMHLR
jgi:cytochrome P450